MKLPYEPNRVVNEQLKRESLLFGIREGWGLFNNYKALGWLICIRDLNHTGHLLYGFYIHIYIYIST